MVAYKNKSLQLSGRLFLKPHNCLPMKWSFLLLFIFVGTLSGCGLKDREAAVRKKEAELAQKEQALAEKDKALQLKEEALLAKEQKLSQADSTTKITASIYNPALVGQWTARMI